MTVRRATALVFGAALIPVVLLVIRAVTDELGANPIEAITHDTGIWTLRLLLVTLALTPVRRVTGWNVLTRFRRMVGLFAFFYACLHILTYVVLDHFFAFDFIVEDVIERPYITAGFTGFVLLIPLAVTSTRVMVGRLGGRRWQLLHRLIYVSATAGVVHFLWQAKVDLRRPGMYALVLGALLGFRLIWRYRSGQLPLTSLSDQS